MDRMGHNIVDTITQYLFSQRRDVQGLVHQIFTGEHREYELVQTHAFLPHVHAPDDLGAQLQVLVQLLLLELSSDILWRMPRQSTSVTPQQRKIHEFGSTQCC